MLRAFELVCCWFHCTERKAEAQRKKVISSNSHLWLSQVCIIRSSASLFLLLLLYSIMRTFIIRLTFGVNYRLGKRKKKIEHKKTRSYLVQAMLKTGTKGRIPLHSEFPMRLLAREMLVLFVRSGHSFSFLN